MLLKCIRLTNFMSFYDKQILQLQRGLNLVVGPGMSGKTNLARAFCFAVTGHTDPITPLNQLINRRHRKETPTPSCRVEVEINHAGKKWLAQNSLSSVGERIMQSSAVDADMDEINISKKLRHIIIDPERYLDKLEKKYKNCSVATRWTRVISQQFNLNFDAGIKMAILDGVFEFLDDDHREEILNLIGELPLEQVTILTKWLPDNLETHPCTIHHIEYDFSSDSSRIVESRGQEEH